MCHNFVCCVECHCDVYCIAMAHRATMAHSGRGKDIFRLRKQNTSRPPSMHVDDFMAMGVSIVVTLM